MIKVCTLTALSLFLTSIAHATVSTAMRPNTSPGPVREVVVRTGPSLYFNAEYGLIYSNTGELPARLELRCDSNATSGATNDVTENPKRVPCGGLDVRLQMHSYGLSAFLLDYTRHNPLVIKFHVKAENTLLGDILGSYIGGRAGGGIVFGGRAMVLVNSSSGVFATTGQSLSPVGDQTNGNSGFHVGVDLSVPHIEILADPSVDGNQVLSNFLSNSSVPAIADAGV